MRPFVSAIVFALIGLAVRPAIAQSIASPTMIELFTSQGCSSCPPADALLGTMADDPHVIALSWPVDYWDYIGWKDTLASPEFTARQKAYAAQLGGDGVFTPQAVIDGRFAVIGSRKADVVGASSKAATTREAVAFRVSGTPETALHVDVGAASGPRHAGIWLARVARLRIVHVGRGENRGRDLAFRNVVRSLHKVGEWNGRATQVVVPPAPAGDADGYVVFLQADDAPQLGPILAAAKGGAL